MRGEVRQKRDVDVTEEDIQGSNLILWGDAASNRLIAKVLPELPLQWGGAGESLSNSTVNNGLVTSGTFDETYFVGRNDILLRESELLSAGWNIEFDLSENWMFEFDASTSLMMEVNALVRPVVSSAV